MSIFTNQPLTVIQPLNSAHKMSWNEWRLWMCKWDDRGITFYIDLCHEAVSGTL